MKAKLLKTIRKDKRFWIYKEGEIKGYPNSGWWYCYDIKLKCYLKRKHLRETLEEYIRFYRLRLRGWYTVCLFLSQVILLLFLCCSCSPQPTEIWNPYSSDVSGDSSAVFFDSIPDPYK